MLYYYYDWTYILVVIGAVICIAASARVKKQSRSCTGTGSMMCR